MTATVVPLEWDEAPIWSGRPRLATILPEAAAGLVVIAVTLAAAVQLREPLVAAFAVVGIAIPLWKYLVVTNTAFLVTDRACYRKSGVLSRDVRRIGLDRVQNSAFRQGIRGSLLDYGTVVVEAAGGGRLEFHAVMDPGQVRTMVDARIGAADVPGSVAAWEAVLEEVRALRAALVEG